LLWESADDQRSLNRMLDQLDSFSESEVVSETPASASHMGREDPSLEEKTGLPSSCSCYSRLASG